jgi:manganese oxidase
MNKTALYAALSLAALTGACSSADEPPAAKPSAVTIQGFTFRPATLQVASGTTVTWSNTDSILHTATSGAPGSPTGVFDLKMPDAGTEASFTFDKAGSYPYFCSRHNAMTGTITVA